MASSSANSVDFAASDDAQGAVQAALPTLIEFLSNVDGILPRMSDSDYRSLSLSAPPSPPDTLIPKLLSSLSSTTRGSPKALTILLACHTALPQVPHPSIPTIVSYLVPHSASTGPLPTAQTTAHTGQASHTSLTDTKTFSTASLTALESMLSHLRSLSTPSAPSVPATSATAQYLPYVQSLYSQCLCLLPSDPGVFVPAYAALAVSGRLVGRPDIVVEFAKKAGGFTEVNPSKYPLYGKEGNSRYLELIGLYHYSLSGSLADLGDYAGSKVELSKVLSVPNLGAANPLAFPMPPEAYAQVLTNGATWESTPSAPPPPDNPMSSLEGPAAEPSLLLQHVWRRMLLLDLLTDPAGKGPAYELPATDAVPGYLLKQFKVSKRDRGTPAVAGPAAGYCGIYAAFGEGGLEGKLMGMRGDLERDGNFEMACALMQAQDAGVIGKMRKVYTTAKPEGLSRPAESVLLDQPGLARIDGAGFLVFDVGERPGDGEIMGSIERLVEAAEKIRGMNNSLETEPKWRKERRESKKKTTNDT